jgi:pimeloyl-ACP methyl ester carboxylesterase
MLNTTAQKPLSERIVAFDTRDGLSLNLINVRGSKKPDRGPVILVHGAGVRGNIFRAPVQTTIVDALIAHGYDVWLENWRASVDFPLTDWTLDKAARYDHPAAVQTVVKETGASRVKAIIHCQGSTSFAMSALAGLIPQVDTIVTNAVSIHTVVPAWSGFKLKYVIPAMRPILRSMNPGWGDKAPGFIPKVLNLMVKASHHECNNTACRLVSFTYGSGFPALWRHENLNADTHDWFIQQEFGHVPLSFFRQMARCVSRGNLVSADKIDGLPADYCAQPPQTDARFAFFAGEMNQCFLPESQRRSYEWLSGFKKDFHSLQVFPNYSHLDLFMGTKAAHDIFPKMIAALDGAP